MNQLSVSEKRFPRSAQDIATDYFALRKIYNGTRWVFAESRNSQNPASHCDIAWAGALATHTHTQCKCTAGAASSTTTAGSTEKNSICFPTI